MIVVRIGLKELPVDRNSRSIAHRLMIKQLKQVAKGFSQAMNKAMSITGVTVIKAVNSANKVSKLKWVNK